MNKASFTKDINYGEDKIVTKVILETSFSKEIRILLKKGQTIKEHNAPFPIIVHIIEGEINFGINGKIASLKMGDIITLESNVSHDLKAIKNSVVRLSLSKNDQASRVEGVINKS